MSNFAPSRPMGPPTAADGAVASPAGERFCVTTAINYANGPPHMGHAYEAITADVIARYHRAYGREVRLLHTPRACCPAAPGAHAGGPPPWQVLFMTGADEHGQKIAETAQRQGATPMELCDQYVAKFQARLALRAT